MEEQIEIGDSIGNEKDDIRIQQSGKGGIMYEVVLSKPASEIPKSFLHPPKNVFSKEDIDKKLEAALERKKCLQLKKNKFITKQRRAADKVKEKKEVFHNNFIQFARESLEQKMVSVKENKEKVKLTKIKAPNAPFVSNDDCNESAETYDILLEKIETIEKKRSECLKNLKTRLHSQNSLLDKAQKDVEVKSLHMKQAFESTVESLREKCQSAVKEIENDKDIMKHLTEEMAICGAQEEEEQQQKIQATKIRGIQETEKRGTKDAEKRAIQETEKEGIENTEKREIENLEKQAIQESEKRGFANIAKSEIEEMEKRGISQITKLVAEDIAKHGIEKVSKRVTKEMEKSRTEEIEKHGNDEIAKDKIEEMEQHVLDEVKKCLSEEIKKHVTEEVQRCLTEEIVKHGIEEAVKCEF